MDVGATLRCKVAVCGRSGVGKTSLIDMFASQGKRFPKDYEMTAGVEVSACSVTVPGTTTVVELYVFDTSGNKLYWDLVPQYWNGVTSAILVYDVTKPTTLDDCKKWHELLLQLRKDKSESLNCVLVANKIDRASQDGVGPLERDGKEWAAEMNMPFIQASAALPGTNYEDPFVQIATQFYNIYEEKLASFEND